MWKRPQLGRYATSSLRETLAESLPIRLACGARPVFDAASSYRAISEIWVELSDTKQHGTLSG
jgi:hypothetical protein